MSETSASAAPTADTDATLDPRRWLILGTVGLAQLMVVLDATIVNIALPSAQRDLGFTTVERQWVVTAYALAFGSLLLFGSATSTGAPGRSLCAARPAAKTGCRCRATSARCWPPTCRRHARPR